MQNSESSPDSPDAAPLDPVPGGRPKSESDTEEVPQTIAAGTNAGEPTPKGPPAIPK